MTSSVFFDFQLLNLLREHFTEQHTESVPAVSLGAVTAGHRRDIFRDIAEILQDEVRKK